MADEKITESGLLSVIKNNTIFPVVDPDEGDPADQNKHTTGASLLNFTGGGGSSYTDQMARDAVGAMLADTDTIDQTYNSGTASMIFQVKRQMSIDYNASGIKLVNDVASPAANQFYGANGSGVRGWQTALTAFNKNFGTGAGTIAEGDHNHTGVYEPAFSKNTAFNKNFGTASGTVAQGDHLHSGVYEPAFTKNSAFNKNFAGTGVATTVSRSDHNHDSTYSALAHNHAGVYEPVFSKNTAFNKNFGTTAGTVAEGDHNHDAAYSEIGHNHDTLYVKLAGASAMASGAHISYATQGNTNALTVGTKEGSGGTIKHAYIDFNVDTSTNIARVDLIAGIGGNAAGFSAILNGADPGASYSLLQGLTRYAGIHTFTNPRDVVDKEYVDSVSGTGMLSSPAAVALNAPSPILFDDLAYTDYAVTTHNFRFLSLFLQNPVNKRIVSVYRRGTAHLTDGDIYMVRSATGGGDWEKNVSDKVIEVEVISNDNAIFDVGTNDLRNLFGGYTKNGRLIVGFVEYQSGADVFYDMWTMYSDDDGDTWSEPYAMPVVAGHTRWSPFGRIVEKWDHEQSANCLYFTFNMRTGATLSDWHDIYIWRSFDNGATWLEADILNVINGGVLGGTTTTPTHDTYGAAPLAVGHQRQNEPFMVHLGGDYLLLITRPYNFFDTDYGGGYQYLSRDGGQTWEFEGRTPFDMGTKDWDVATGQSSDNYGSPITIDYLEYGGVGFVLAQVLWRETGTWYHVMARADELIENGVDGWDMNSYTVLKDDFTAFVAHGYGGSVFFSNRLKGMVMTWIVVSSSIQTPIFRWIDEEEMVFHVDRLIGRGVRWPKAIELADSSTLILDCKYATEVHATIAALNQSTVITLINVTNRSTINIHINKETASNVTVTLAGTGLTFRGADGMGLEASGGVLPAFSGAGNSKWEISVHASTEVIGGGGETLIDSFETADTSGELATFPHRAQAVHPPVTGVLSAFSAYLAQGSVPPTGNAYIKVYDIVDTYGSGAKPDVEGGVLATSDAINVNTQVPGPGVPAFVKFPFSGAEKINLLDKPYHFVLEYTGSGSTSQTIRWYYNSAGGHGGNRAWTPVNPLTSFSNFTFEEGGGANAVDHLFRLYIDSGSAETVCNVTIVSNAT